MIDIASVRDYFAGLQDRIVGELETIEGALFSRDAWDRPQGGGGVSRLIEDGKLFERGGVNFSHVMGEQMPASATAQRPQLVGRNWQATGVSLVLHPRNPYCPTAHLNVISRPTGADATSSSTWSRIAARCSACNRAGAPNPS